MSKKVQLGHVPWSNYSHERLWRMVMSADPAALQQRATHLDTLATRMGAAGRDAHRTLETLLATWSGGTADQVAAVVRPVLDWMATAATTGTEIAARLGRFAEAVNQAREDMPIPVGTTATPEQAHATKDKAVAVMNRYEAASVQAYHGMPTFTAPPRVPGVHVPPPVSPPQPTPIVPPISPTQQPMPTLSAATTPSDFVGSTSGATGFGGPGGLAGSAVGGISGGVAGGASAALPGAVSGAGMIAATEGELAAMNAAQAEQGGWSGFAPMGAGGQRGAQDGEHRDRYAGRPDLIGELPPAFPPVLGL
jgi:PPE family